ncbi:transposase [Microvirga sp. BT688]|nr:transposase [Microvirga sp.]
MQRLTKEELIEVVLRMQRPHKISRPSSKPSSTGRKGRRDQARLGGAKPGHEGHSRIISATPDEVVEHRPARCSGSSAILKADLSGETISLHEQIDLPRVVPRITQHRRLAVHCPACGTRAVAPVPDAAKGTPFGPRVHAVATYLKTFQALSYERLQSAFGDLFDLTLSQGGLMNLLRRAQRTFAGERDRAIMALPQARVVACDETGVRIEGSNAFTGLSLRRGGGPSRLADPRRHRGSECNERAPARGLVLRPLQRATGPCRRPSDLPGLSCPQRRRCR